MHILKKAGGSNGVKRTLPKASIAISGTSIVRFAQNAEMFIMHISLNEAGC